MTLTSSKFNATLNFQYYTDVTDGNRKFRQLILTDRKATVSCVYYHILYETKYFPIQGSLSDMILSRACRDDGQDTPLERPQILGSKYHEYM